MKIPAVGEKLDKKLNVQAPNTELRRTFFLPNVSAQKPQAWAPITIPEEVERRKE